MPGLRLILAFLGFAAGVTGTVIFVMGDYATGGLLASVGALVFVTALQLWEDLATALASLFTYWR